MNGFTAHSVKDVKCESFSGNSDPGAQVITKEQFSPLLQWLESASFQIQISGLAPEMHVRALVKQLGGTLQEAQGKIISRVPEHRIMSTKHAFNMRFAVKSLQNDVQRYALYMTDGAIAMYGSYVVYQMLQDKLLAVAPDVRRSRNQPATCALTFMTGSGVG